MIFEIIENIISIGDLLDKQRAIGNQMETDVTIRHVGFRSVLSVSDRSCRFPISHVGFRSVMSVSDQSCRFPNSHVGFRSVMSVSD